MVPAIALDRNRRANEQHSETLNSLHPESHYGVYTQDPTVLFFPLSGRDTAIPPVHDGQTGRRSLMKLRNRQFFVSLAATISVFSVFVLCVICKAPLNREQQSGAIWRRLSESKSELDEELSLIAEQCASLEAEMGITLPLSATHSDMEPGRKVAELASMLREAAAAHERVHASTPPLKEASTWTLFRSTEAMTAAEGAAGSQSNCQFEEGDHVPLHTDTLMPPAEADASNEHLYPLQHSSQPLPPPMFLSDQDKEQHRANPSSIDGEPSTSALATEPFHDAGQVKGPSDITNHPFARLPVLGPNILVRKFQPEGLFSRMWTNVSMWTHYLTLHRLFAKSVLNQEDADTLIRTVEALVDATWIQMQYRTMPIRPSLAVAALGQAFLAFDYIVCTVQLLGDAMQLPLWWEKFIGAFDIYYDHRRGRKRQLRPGLNVKLAHRLLNALNIYKTGTRPGIKEVVELKRLLFCFPNSPKPFRASQCNPWREDDIHFMKYGH
ncbi:hypothetical protein, conserved [Eimeria tenella]|uniref:Uncharacterized protein n=1 Tax=Eimeria tenella TaxID=5802 RepID=H9B982_EIMTE|nr:hypothetical protein, conserved [Eimeria tenella]AET50542.1 hypothetical protein [Eimeria tenella]CDJ43106.1 hypothetical protein, conserved [Eimeria tenella]|eukprot:XP_013233856.1 hypothetical protein, conserved [Eimeria tenella]